jgi:outer membrane protein OmpA-like peptidoglycan-associated protein
LRIVATFERGIAMRTPFADATLAPLSLLTSINPNHLKQEFPMSSWLYLFAVIAGLSVAKAHSADDPSAYLIQGQDSSPVTTGYGGCVHTSAWVSGLSYRQCDPQPIAMERPVPPAPVETAAIQKEPEPMRMVAESPTPQAPSAVPFRLSMDALFDFDSAILRTDAGAALDVLARQIAQADYRNIDIVGHADRIGRAKYNQQLSEARAKAVREYLVAHGADGSRIAVSGVGSSAPVTGSDCEAMRGKLLVSCLQRDRYAEVKVTGTQASAMR